MTDMLHAIATAIRPYLHEPEGAIFAAKDALRTLMTPSQSMKEAGTEVVIDNGRGGNTALNWEEADEVFRRMLLAAMGDEK